MSVVCTVSRSVLRWALRGVLVIAAVAFLGLGVVPRTGLYHTLTVLSGSMRPTFGAGDLLIVRPEPMRDLRAGQIMTYAIPVGNHHIESHRVVAVIESGDSPVVRTEGDANNVVDPWTARLHGKRVWVTAAVIPYAGWPLQWLREPAIKLACLLFAPLLLVTVGLINIWRPRPFAGCGVD